MGKIHFSIPLLVALAFLGCVAAAPDDFAVVTNTGSTNANGYVIQVWANGDASVTMRTKDGVIAGIPRPFQLPPTTAGHFFADLAAVRKANAATVPCMKTVSFGSSINVWWQGWQSADLTCPPKDAVGEALVQDAQTIAQLAGVATTSP